ncbi:MAG: hypothetical protein L0Z50_26195 [Verrucomicrobiales bacterium]|nr:hypothetical protein [Verrucomicrobiales bacterium]
MSVHAQTPLPFDEALRRVDYKGRHLNKVADLTTLVPGQPQLRFREFQNVLLHENVIYFIGIPHDPVSGRSSWGTYRFAEGRLTEIANEQTPIQGDWFSGFSIGGLDALLFSTSLGIFRMDQSGQVTSIMRRSEMVSAPSGPWGLDFSSFGTPVSVDSVTYFLAGFGRGAQASLYSWDGNAVTPVLTPGNPLPGGALFLVSGTIEQLVANEHLLAVKYFDSEKGKVLVRPVGGDFVSIANSGDPVPGRPSETYSPWSTLSLSGSSLFFDGTTQFFDRQSLSLKYRRYLLHYGPSGLELVAELPLYTGFIASAPEEVVFFVAGAGVAQGIELWNHGTRTIIAPPTEFFDQSVRLASADTNNLVIVRGPGGQPGLYSTLPRLLEPPVILTQPKDTMIVAGSFQRIFSVDVLGPEPLTVEWYKDGILLADKAGFPLLGPASTNDTGIYHAVISNQDGAVTSEKARLTVVPPTPAPLFGNPFREIPKPPSPFISFGRFPRAAARSGIVAAVDNGKIYRYDQDAWRTVLNTETPLPDGILRIADMGWPYIGDNGEIVFVGQISRNLNGLFQIDANGVVSRLIGSTNPAPTFASTNLYPGFGPFGAYVRPVQRNGALVYLGVEPAAPRSGYSYVWEGALYRQDRAGDTVIRAFAPPDDLKNLVAFTFDFDGQSLAFAGLLDTKQAIYIQHEGQPLEALAKAGDALAGTDVKLDKFSAVSIRGTHVAFVAGPLLVETTDKGLRLIAQVGQDESGIGQIAGFRQVRVLDQRRVLFTFGSMPLGGGAAIWDGSLVHPIATPRHSINGKTIMDFTLIDADDKEVWFGITYADRSSLLAVASLRSSQEIPRLQYEFTQGGLKFKWDGDFQLQLSRDLHNWGDLPGKPPLIIPIESVGTQFFRLRGFL